MNSRVMKVELANPPITVAGQRGLHLPALAQAQGQRQQPDHGGQGGHQHGAEAPAAGRQYRLAQGQAVAPAQQVGGVHQAVLRC